MCKEIGGMNREKYYDYYVIFDMVYGISTTKKNIYVLYQPTKP